MEKTIANNMWNKKEVKICSIFFVIILLYIIIQNRGKSNEIVVVVKSINVNYPSS